MEDPRYQLPAEIRAEIETLVWVAVYGEPRPDPIQLVVVGASELRVRRANAELN